MIAIDIIDRVDMMEPNQFSPEQKLRWLNALDGRVYLEVFMTHSIPGAPENIPEIQTGSEELLIASPYGEDIYYNYLQAMIAAENGENTRYNKRMALFNSSFTAWQNYINRRYAPAGGGQFVY